MNNLIKKLLLFFMLAVSYIGYTQNRTCGSNLLLDFQLNQNSNVESRYNLEKYIKDFKPELIKSNITIPVVVHVLYNTLDQNISDAQIASQIKVLNEDFTRTNIDAWNTPSEFMQVVADMKINFCLANQDPNGNPTSGIVRKETPISFFPLFNNSVYFDSLGGSSSWDPKRYLNIWVCKVEDGFLGWAQFPAAGLEETDGVVIDFEHFGTTGTAKYPYNLGRTATHEIGHWLNLIHIWGDNNCGDDLVFDTPVQEDANFGCLIHPSTSCGNTGDMFMNFMDYTDDACMNSFTYGQRTRAWATITYYRNSLLNSNGCDQAIISIADAGIIDVINPSNQNQYCSSPVYPKVVIKNYGDSLLTTAKIKYKVDAGSFNFQQWNGSLQKNETDTVSLSGITTNGGNSHVFYCATEMPNHGIDINPNNDQFNKIYTSIIGQLVNIELITDNYANETSWQLIDGGNNIIISDDNLQNNTDYNYDLCLENDCYTFILNDSYGDGFCCDFGNGSYTISLKENPIPIKHGTFFTFNDSISFCIGSINSLQNLEKEDLKLFPNPARDKIYINHSSISENTPIFVKIFNNQGKTVFENQIYLGEPINIDNLNDGFYLIKIETANSFIINKFIITK